MKDLVPVWIFIVVIPVIALVLLNDNVSGRMNDDPKFNINICMDPNQNCVDIQGEDR